VLLAQRIDGALEAVQAVGAALARLG